MAAAAPTDDERTREMMELLEKLKKASKAPEQAAQKIRELDKMVHRLKESRRVCQAAIDADEEKLRWIVREEDAIHVRLDPLEAHLAEREATAETIRKQLEECTRQFQSVLSTTSTGITAVRMKDAKHRKDVAVAGLRAERGYSASRTESRRPPRSPVVPRK